MSHYCHAGLIIMITSSTLLGRHIRWGGGVQRKGLLLSVLLHGLKLSVGAVEAGDVLLSSLQLHGPRSLEVALGRASCQVELSGLKMEGQLARLIA